MWRQYFSFNIINLKLRNLLLCVRFVKIYLLSVHGKIYFKITIRWKCIGYFTTVNSPQVTPLSRIFTGVYFYIDRFFSREYSY